MEIKDNGKSFEGNRALVAKRHKRWRRLGIRERVEPVVTTLLSCPPRAMATTMRVQIPFHNGA